MTEGLASAMVAALADLTVVGTDHTANAGSYSYKYADLADIVKLTRPVLAEHGLVVTQSIHAEGTGLAVTTTILHTSGEANYFGPLPFPYGRDAQATGSAITYHRRYALLAALGMATGEDDDGARAIPASPFKQAKAHVLHLAGGDKTLAKHAWDGMGAQMDWPSGQLDIAYETWINQPKEGDDATEPA